MSVTVFVGGPIQHAFGAKGFDARLRADVLLVATAFADAGFRVRSAHVAEGFGRLPAGTAPASVVRRDHDWMVECDAYVALLPCDARGRHLPSAGTAVELGWASLLAKPTVVVHSAPHDLGLSTVIRGLGALTHVEFLDYRETMREPERCVGCVRRALAVAEPGTVR